MNELNQFLKGMEGTWEVTKHEWDIQAKRTKVIYKSLLVDGLEWSHYPFDQKNLPPTGTIGYIGFVWSKQ